MSGRIEAVWPRAYVAAFRILGRRDEARDACQEAAQRALSAADRYDPARPFYPWFHRIVKNCCLDRIARRKAAGAREAALEVEPAAPGPTAEASMLMDERARAVTAAIAELPEELRAVIELRHFQDASYAEMAEILEIPTGTVMSRLFRARNALRTHLAEALASGPAVPAGRTT